LKGLSFGEALTNRCSSRLKGHLDRKVQFGIRMELV
jgi:hypothetical protein